MKMIKTIVLSTLLAAFSASSHEEKETGNDHEPNAGATEYIIIFSADGTMRVINASPESLASGSGQPGGGVNIQIRAPSG